MKKISILIALCMLLTVGGVYATWIYSGNQLASQTEPFVSKMGVLGYEGTSGSYTFTHNDLDFAVEPDDQQTKNTTIAWGSGSMTLVFTPKKDISDVALANALNATLTVEISSSSAGVYNEETVFSVDPGFKVVLNTEENAWVETTNENGTYYTYTITADTIKGAISIGNFSLPTEDDYNDFKAAINDVTFRVRVTPINAIVTPDAPQA